MATARRRQYYWDNPEYYRQKSREWRSTNKEKHRSYNKNWSKTHPRKRSKIVRRSAFRAHGITETDYDLMLQKQQGKCALCGTDNPSTKRQKNWCIDHDHATGKVRGLLCMGCNLSIGWYERCKDKIDKIEAYLSHS